MPITQQELGRRLRQAREACRMTQDVVADRLGVSRPTVSQMEAGNRAVTSIELSELAFLYGRDISEFLADEFRTDDVLSALFRAQPEVINDDAVMEKLRECVALGRELSNLERLVHGRRPLAYPANYNAEAPRNKWEAIRQGIDIAEAERRRLGLGDGPVQSLMDLLDTQGVRTGQVDLPEEISGVAFTDPSLGLFVVVNKDHPILRRRFSFAHEYAHVLLDRDRSGVVSVTNDRDDLIEVRANSFAANFLMPADGLERYVNALGKGLSSRPRSEVFDNGGVIHGEIRTAPGSQEIQLYDVVQLAHHFGVSRVAAIFRLNNLKMLSDEGVQRMRDLEDSGKGRELAKLLDLPELDHQKDRNEFRRRFLGLALEAYRRDQVSKAKVRELAIMVGLKSREVGNLLRGAGLVVPEPPESDNDVLLPTDHA